MILVVLVQVCMISWITDDDDKLDVERQFET